MAELARSTQEVTLPRFMKLTKEFINQEELILTLLKAQTLEEQAKQEGKKAPTAPKPKEEKNPQKGEKKPGPISFKSKPRKIEAPRFQQEVFTPLNASFTKVFMAIKGDPTFRWPLKMRSEPIIETTIDSVNTMGSMGIQWKIAWFSDERLKPLSRTGSWLVPCPGADSESESTKASTIRRKSRRL